MREEGRGEGACVCACVCSAVVALSNMDFCTSVVRRCFSSRDSDDELLPDVLAMTHQRSLGIETKQYAPLMDSEAVVLHPCAYGEAVLRRRFLRQHAR